MIVGHITVLDGSIVDRSTDDAGSFERVRINGGTYPVRIDSDGTYFFAELIGTRILEVTLKRSGVMVDVKEDETEVPDFRTGLGCWNDYFSISDDTFRGFPFEAREIGAA